MQGARTAFGEVTEQVALLLSAGGHNTQDPCHELTARGTIGSITRLAPLHGMADGPFRGVVGRFKTFDTYKRPQGWLDLQQLSARRCRLGAAASAARF